MKKSHEGHAIAYQRMRQKGVRSWDETQGTKRITIDPDTERFLIDAFSQPWAPKNGRAIEIGCGTAPILRWICKRGFRGFGVDVSRTAIAMARKQSNGLDIEFTQADICHCDAEKSGKFDLAVDGHCLHCIIEPEDRKAFLENTWRLLRKGGLFVVITMCAPVDRKAFSDICRGQRLLYRTIFAPYERAGEYQGFRTIDGCAYIPTHKVTNWRSILSEVRKAGSTGEEYGK